MDDNLPNPTITAERNRIAQLILRRLVADLVRDENTYINKEMTIHRVCDAITALCPKLETPEHRNRGD